MSDQNETLCCNFCSKTAAEVAKLVAGPGVFICDACVALCQIYIDHPVEDGKLKLEDGKPVMRDGHPVFEPPSPEEQQQRDEWLEKR